MVSPTPEEAATERAGRSEGYLLSLLQEHNPGQTVSISERPPLSLAQKALSTSALCSVFPASARGLQTKYPGGCDRAEVCKEVACEAIFPLGISLHIKNTHWPPPHPLGTPSSSPTFAPEGANSLCLC